MTLAYNQSKPCTCDANADSIQTCVRHGKAGRSKAARARKLHTSLEYRVDVIGITWAGYEGSYVYTFPFLPTQLQITQRSGDFESITDYQTTAVTRIQFTDGYRVQRKIIDSWQRPESEDKFAEMQG